MTIGKLSVLLGLNSSTFNSGMNSAADRVRRFDREVETPQTGMQKLISGFGAVKTAFLAVGAAIGAGAIVRGVARQISAIDELNDAAQKLGVIPQQLIGLQHAAELSGVGAEGMNDALQKMSIGIAQAAQGAGPAKDALAELGLSAQTLAQMTPDQALMRIADAMEGVAGKGDKMRLAMAIFGRGGVDMVRTLEGGSEGLRDMADEAEKLGLTLTALDIREIGQADDAFVRMKQSIKGVWTQLAIFLAPSFKAIANLITSIATGLSAVFRSAGQGFRIVQMEAVYAGAKIWEVFRKVFGDSQWRQDTQRWLNQSLADLEAEVAEFENPAEAVGDSIGTIATGLDDATEKANELKEALDFRPKLLEEGTQDFYDAIAKWNQMQVPAKMNRPAAAAAQTEPEWYREGYRLLEPAEPDNVTRVTPGQDNTAKAMLAELKRISSESGRASAASVRTASAVEQLQLPVTMEF